MSRLKRCTNCTAGILCECDSFKSRKTSNVDHPDHYLKKSGYEVIDVIEAWNLDFSLGNAIKYIARAGKKDPSKTKEDLNKAIWYIQNELKKL